MADGSADNESDSSRRPNTWVRRLWLIAAVGLAVAVAPPAIAAVGLIVDSQYLQTYHWRVYFSAPIGVPITLIASVAALILMVRKRMRKQRSV